jgi:hypothetical protein
VPNSTESGRTCVTGIDQITLLYQCRLCPGAREVKESLPFFIALGMVDAKNSFLGILPELIGFRHDTSPMCPTHRQPAFAGSAESGRNRSLSNANIAIFRTGRQARKSAGTTTLNAVFSQKRIPYNGT